MLQEEGRTGANAGTEKSEGGMIERDSRFCFVKGRGLVQGVRNCLKRLVTG